MFYKLERKISVVCLPQKSISQTNLRKFEVQIFLS